MVRRAVQWVVWPGSLPYLEGWAWGSRQAPFEAFHGVFEEVRSVLVCRVSVEITLSE